MELSDYAQALGAAQRLVPNLRDLRQQDAQTAILEQQPALIQQQIAASQQQTALAGQKAQYDEQRRTQFQAALGQLGTKPTPDKLYALSTQFPEFGSAINTAAKGVSEEKRQATVRQLAPIQSLIQNGQTDRALEEVNRHIKADQAAGLEPDEDDIHLRDALASGDKDQIKAASGTLYALIAAVNPDTAAANIQKRQDSNTHVVSQGGALVGDDGTVLYQSAPAETNALEVPVYDDQGRRIGTRLIANGGKGGGQASGGGGAGGSGAPAGRTTGGWTPSRDNGGDNPPEVTAAKIAGARQFLGVAPGADISGISPRRIAEAMTLSEGGKGTLADRNNNPANIKFGSFAKSLGATKDPNSPYAVFPSKAAGLTAATQLVAGKLKRGHTTVETMVGGLPAGGTAAAPGDAGYVGPVSTGGGGDPNTTGDAFLASLPAGRRNLLKNIYEGKAAPPRPGSKFGEALSEDLARAYPDADTTKFATRQQTMTAFSKGKQGDTVRSLNVAIDHLGVLHDAALALNNGNVPLFNKLSQRFQKATGSPLPTNAAAIASIVGDEVTKAVVGSAGALADREELKSNLNAAGSPAQIMGITRSYISLMAGQAKGLQQQYEQGTGNKDFGRFLNRTTAKQLGIGNPNAKVPGPTPAPPGGKLVGTYQGRQVFQLPNGKRVVAK